MPWIQTMSRSIQIFISKWWGVGSIGLQLPVWPMRQHIWQSKVRVSKCLSWDRLFEMARIPGVPIWLHLRSRNSSNLRRKKWAGLPSVIPVGYGFILALLDLFPLHSDPEELVSSLCLYWNFRLKALLKQGQASRVTIANDEDCLEVQLRAVPSDGRQIWQWPW